MDPDPWYRWALRAWWPCYNARMQTINWLVGVLVLKLKANINDKMHTRILPLLQRFPGYYQFQCDTVFSMQSIIWNPRLGGPCSFQMSWLRDAESTEIDLLDFDFKKYAPEEVLKCVHPLRCKQNKGKFLQQKLWEDLQIKQGPKHQQLRYHALNQPAWGHIGTPR